MNTSLNALHPTVAAYLEATNNQDPAAFLACFTEGAAVQDAGHEWRGLGAIRTWSEREIFAPQVTLELIAASVQESETVVTTRVEGNFDRTGLPDPVLVEHHITLAGDEICRLICRLARGTVQEIQARALSSR